MSRQRILDAAASRINGDRDEQYGTPIACFSRIARLWNAYLNRRTVYDPVCKGAIGARDVAAMMALVKIARIKQESAHPDNWIDLAGYAACGGEIEEME